MTRRLFRRLMRWSRAVSAASQGGPDALERLEMERSRRRFLAAGGASALGLVVGGCASGRPTTMRRDPAGPRIAIVGAGIAGLVCCHRLAQAGVHAEVYEASGRPAGRVMSVMGLVDGLESTPIELGGELVDSVHTALRALAAELGTPLVTLPEDEDLEDAYVVDGTRYSVPQILARLAPVVDHVRAMRAGLVDDGEELSYRFAAGGEALDRTSLAEFLQQAGGDRVINTLLEAIYISEYGLDAERQSALNLVLELDLNVVGHTLRPIEDADEVSKFAEGADSIPRTLAERYADRVHYGHRLEALSQRDPGAFVLTLDDSGRSRDVSADVVVLALPFSVLRQVRMKVDLPPVKRRVIQELSYGTNVKLAVPFSSRFWRQRGDSGYAAIDIDRQTTWDATRLLPGRPGVIASFVGGAVGVARGDVPTAALSERFLTGWRALYPDAAMHRVGAARQHHWPSDPNSRGSYSAYGVGQWTTIGGAEAEAVGRLHFCGEHTSWNFQGYMNGAAESGERAANEVLQGLGRIARAHGQGPPRAARRRRA